MAKPVELNVRSKLGQIAEELRQISEASTDAQQNMSSFGKKVGETHSEGVQKTQRYLGNLQSVGARVFDRMKQDFKAMVSTVGIAQGLKLGSTFRDSVKETFALSDAIRKLGGVFGITGDRFESFQERITKGLGEIGLGADTAINALQGLAETQVRGEEELTNYARTAGELAATTGTQGQEGDIARGIARVLTVQGTDPNDIKAMRQLAEDLRRAYNATGQSPKAILDNLERLLSRMPKDLRESIQPSGLVQLGTITQVAGPGSAAFLEEYLGKSPVARKALEARGFEGVFGPEGFDPEKFRRAAKSIIDAFPDDPRLMAQTLGLSEEAAEGFIRLYQSLDRVQDAQKRMADDTRTLATQYRDAMGAAEAFRASLNRVKAAFSEPLSAITNVVTEGLKTGAETETGATVVVSGAAILSALLFGGGVRNLGGALLGKGRGEVERQAFEKVTGRQVQDVYVVNAGEIGAAASTGLGTSPVVTQLSGIAGLLAKAGLVTAAAAGGYFAGGLINEQIKGTELDEIIDSFLQRAFTALSGGGGQQPPVTTVETPEGQIAPDVLGRVPQIVTQSGERVPLREPATQQTKPSSGPPAKPQRVDVNVRVDVEAKRKDLKATARPSRGGSQ